MILHFTADYRSGPFLARALTCSTIGQYTVLRTMDWQQALRPEVCAVLCMEMQKGVVADARDIESRRYHGVAPFTAMDLYSHLRAMHVETLVVEGVSLNLGVTGLCIEAVDLGYRVLVVEDAVNWISDQSGVYQNRDVLPVNGGGNPAR